MRDAPLLDRAKHLGNLWKGIAGSCAVLLGALLVIAPTPLLAKIGEIVFHPALNPTTDVVAIPHIKLRFAL